MNAAQRRQFDQQLEAVLATLPARLHDLLDEAPLIVEDRPSPALCAEPLPGSVSLARGLESGSVSQAPR